MKARYLWVLLGVLVVAGLVGFVVLPQLRQRQIAAATANVTTEQVKSMRSVTTVEASGSIAPLQTALLFWKTTGTVATVPVKVGDQVKAGQVLMTLDAASAPANVIQAQSELLSAQKALDDLLHPTTLTIANAQQAVADAQTALDKAQRDLRHVSQPDVDYYQDQLAKKQQALLQAQQNAEKANIGDLKTALQNAKDNLDKKTNQYNDAQTAQSQCPGCTVVFVNATGRRMELSQAEKEYNDAVNAYRVAELNYQQALANNNDSVATAQDALDTAQANLAAAQAGPDALDLAQKQAAAAVAEAKLADAQDKLDKLQHGAAADDIAAAQARVQSAQATVDGLTLRAPFDGEVLAVDYQPGDPASQSTAAIKLANRSQLHVDVSVDESEIARIAAGDPVSLTVDALPGLNLDGTVGAVEAFGETVQGLVRYHVRVELAGSDPRLYLNMTANTVIVTDVQDAALAVPVNAVQFDNDGEYVNRVRADGSTERVDVVSGQTEGDWVVVTGSLQPGDTVQVKAPEPTRPIGGGPFGG